ncbi:MAG: hypothetical protein HOQ24_10540 [Mycobacteriaceae bacterium]|nr:hypothetical protein [Mycobacteriaceae bacterium]
MAAVKGNTLNAGDQLGIDESLVSDNGLFRLTMQADGNAVLYGPTADPTRRDIWNATSMWSTLSQASGLKSMKVVNDQLGTQIAGLTIRDPVTNEPVKGGGRIYLGNDGNLIMYDKSGREVWKSGTARPLTAADGLPHLHTVILVQPDGGSPVLRGMVSAAEAAMQRSVDLLGDPKNTTTPPDFDGALLGWGVIDTSSKAVFTPRYNGLAVDLHLYATGLRDSDVGIANLTVQTTEGAAAAIRRIEESVQGLNRFLSSVRPPVAVTPNAKGKDTFHLTSEDELPAINEIVSSSKEVEDVVAVIAEANRQAAGLVTPPSTDPPSVAAEGEDTTGADPKPDPDPEPESDPKPKPKPTADPETGAGPTSGSTGADRKTTVTAGGDSPAYSADTKPGNDRDPLFDVPGDDNRAEDPAQTAGGLFDADPDDTEPDDAEYARRDPWMNLDEDDFEDALSWLTDPADRTALFGPFHDQSGKPPTDRTGIAGWDPLAMLDQIPWPGIAGMPSHNGSPTSWLGSPEELPCPESPRELPGLGSLSRLEAILGPILGAPQLPGVTSAGPVSSGGYGFGPANPVTAAEASPIMPVPRQSNGAGVTRALPPPTWAGPPRPSDHAQDHIEVTSAPPVDEGPKLQATPLMDYLRSFMPAVLKRTGAGDRGKDDQ